MPDILLRNLPLESVERLKRDAQRHHRSLQAELRGIVEAELERRSEDEFWHLAAELRASIGPQRTDSTELIRADRDSDYGNTE